MIVIIVVILILLLYFGVGDYLFGLGVDQIGGKDEYIRLIEEDNVGIDSRRAHKAYCAAYLIFVTVWPLFIFRRKKK